MLLNSNKNSRKYSEKQTENHGKQRKIRKIMKNNEKQRKKCIANNEENKKTQTLSNTMKNYRKTKCRKQCKITKNLGKIVISIEK